MSSALLHRVSRDLRAATWNYSKFRCFGTALVAAADERFTKYASPTPGVVHHSSNILAAPPTQISVLSNGLRVATESRPHAQTATVGVWIDAGSRFETAATNGTAHFLEHMMFKGTKNRTQRALEEDIENMGAHLNAFTSREQTTYYLMCRGKQLGAAVDVLADILQNSNFDERNIERERDVILREMEEVEGQAVEVLFDHLHATAFQHSPLGRTILGPADNIRSITRANLSDYISSHYTSPRMVLAAAGAVDHEQLVKFAEKSFSSLPSTGASAADLIAADPSIFTGSEVRIRDDDMPLVHLAIAFSGASLTDPDVVPLMVMQTMLGAWNKAAGAGKHMGSELAQKLAANDLAESYTSFNTNYSDAGLFGIYAVAKPGDSLQDLGWCIMHELARLIYRVDEYDVARAQNQLKSSLLLHMDSTSTVADDIGRQLLTYGRRLSLPELFARIDAVTPDTVKRVADRFIYDKDPVIAALGPTQFLPDYNWFRRRTFWLRY